MLDIFYSRSFSIFVDLLGVNPSEEITAVTCIGITGRRRVRATPDKLFSVKRSKPLGTAHFRYCRYILRRRNDAVCLLYQWIKPAGS
jgi:hypothetical protein